MTTHRWPHRWASVDDGIVFGRLLRKSHPCDVCGDGAACIFVEAYEMPPTVPYTATIISLTDRQSQDQSVAVYLGISCGCYAKFHRQVSHIKDSIEEGTWPY